MKITPKSEKELAEMNLWTVGEYSFEVLDAEDTTSKAGNEMIKLKVSVFNNEGGHKILFDYLLDSMAHKVRHIADACGLIDKYEAGSLEAIDLKGKTGVLKLKITKDKAGQYPDKNEIADYVPGKKSDAAASKPKNGAAAEAMPDDSIPF